MSSVHLRNVVLVSAVGEGGRERFSQSVGDPGQTSRVSRKLSNWYETSYDDTFVSYSATEDVQVSGKFCVDKGLEVWLYVACWEKVGANGDNRCFTGNTNTRWTTRAGSRSRRRCGKL